jgi:hypothetical protein
MTDDKRDEILMDMHGKIERMYGVLTGGNGGGLCKDVQTLESQIHERVTYRVMGFVIGGIILVNGAVIGLLKLAGIL